MMMLSHLSHEVEAEVAFEFAPGGGNSAEINLLSSRQIFEEYLWSGHGAEKVDPFPTTSLLQSTAAQTTEVALLVLKGTK